MPPSMTNARANARQILSQVNPFVLFVPVVFTLGVAYFVASGEFAYRGKQQLEVFPFFILVPFTAVGMVRYCAERRPVLLWITALLGSLVCREIHFPGTSLGIMIAIALLIVMAVLRYDALKDGFSTPVFVNLLAAGFTAYFISEMMLDHNWARIPKDFRAEHNFRTVLEETVELLGHFLLAISVVLLPSARSGMAGGSPAPRLE